jgi:xylulokinase
LFIGGDKLLSKPPYLLGIDSGTTACKSVLYTFDGEPVAAASAEHRIYHPRPLWAEQDPDDWWGSVVKTVKDVLKIADAEENDVIGVSVDSQREAVVSLSSQGRKLMNSIIWLDQRAIPQQEKIKKIMALNEVLNITGVPIDFIFSAPKILWIKENMSSVYKKTRTLLCAKDYIVYKLTGEKVTDYSMASRTMLFDLKKRLWSERICEALGINMDLLPPVKGSWEIAGEVTTDAARLTGLREGTPVACGGGDRPCEALGAGVVREGMVNVGTGTGSVFEVPLSRPKIDVEGGIDCCYHVVPDTWEYEILVNSTGASLSWFRDNFGFDEVIKAKDRGMSPYQLFDEEASTIDIGADGLLYYPYLWGARAPVFNPTAKGVFYGFSYGHGRAHFIRAMLEGVTYQYLGILEMLEDLGVSVSKVSMVGGEVKSSLWNQVKADAVNLPIEIPHVTEAATLGSAIIAGLATKTYPDVDRAVKNVVKVESVYNPRPRFHEKYKKVYMIYKQVYRHLEKAFRISDSLTREKV